MEDPVKYVSIETCTPSSNYVRGPDKCCVVEIVKLPFLDKETVYARELLFDHFRVDHRSAVQQECCNSPHGRGQQGRDAGSTMNFVDGVMRRQSDVGDAAV